jgi:hypothetical protein
MTSVLNAAVVKLVYTLASGVSGRKPVEVQVLSAAPSISFLLPMHCFFSVTMGDCRQLQKSKDKMDNQNPQSPQPNSNVPQVPTPGLIAATPPVAQNGPTVSNTEHSPNKSKRLVTLIVGVLLVIVIIAGLVVLLGRVHSNSTKTGAGGSASTASTAASSYVKYTNSQFNFSFMYPANWGTVTISQTTGVQEGASGISSYNASFSDKTGGTDPSGNANPYLFRINSFNWAVANDSSGDSLISPSLAYRVVAAGTDTTDAALSPGLNYCERLDNVSEECHLFSDIGDWTTINNIILAKQSDIGGVALFVPLSADTGQNYTMASFFSTSASDYQAFQKIAQSFTGEMQN